MRGKILLLLALLLAISFLACDKEKENNENPDQPGVLSVFVGDSCLDSPRAIEDSTDSIFIEVNACTVTVNYNVEFNCCPDSMKTNVAFSGDSVFFNETEFVTMPCNCNCTYEREVRFLAGSNGDYILVIAHDSFTRTKSFAVTECH